jgi:hypothetical protein
MAVSTTQSIWRSGGGDQTRTAYAGTGAIDLGTTGYTSGTAAPEAIANALSVAAAGTTSIGSSVTGTPLPAMSYVTTRDNSTTATGAISGYITYFVLDPYVGQQNV